MQLVVAKQLLQLNTSSNYVEFNCSTKLNLLLPAVLGKSTNLFLNQDVSHWDQYLVGFHYLPKSGFPQNGSSFYNTLGRYVLYLRRGNDTSTDLDLILLQLLGQVPNVYLQTLNSKTHLILTIGAKNYAFELRIKTFNSHSV